MSRLKTWWRQRRCWHIWKLVPTDLRADEPGGPKTFHECYFVCTQCGYQRGKERFENA